MQTAIIGLGVVGSALAQVLRDPIVYDPSKKIGNKEEMNKADVVFVCVPTPFDKHFDLSIVVQCIHKLEGSKVVVIKSTILPGTTDQLQDEYPQHRFLFNPEFLREVSSEQDMKYPDRQLVGYTAKSYAIAEDIMAMLPSAPFQKVMRAKEAEMVKYAGNTWLATKVVWMNQLYDLCEHADIDYEQVKQTMAQDKRIGESHLDIFDRGYRGYGGKCLPKDVKSLIQYGHEHQVDMSLLKEVDSINEKLRSGAH